MNKTIYNKNKNAIVELYNRLMREKLIEGTLEENIDKIIKTMETIYSINEKGEIIEPKSPKYYFMSQGEEAYEQYEEMCYLHIRYTCDKRVGKSIREKDIRRIYINLKNNALVVGSLSENKKEITENINLIYKIDNGIIKRLKGIGDL